MKNKNSKIDKMKEIAAKRLKEVMVLKGTESPSTIIKILKEEYDYPIQRQTYYKYQKAVNSMPPEFIEKVSEILGIDKGYLEGKDFFSCASYQEYLEDYPLIENINSMFIEHEANYKRYNNLLKNADLLVGYGTTTDDSDIEYFVKDINDINRRCSYSPAEMEKLYQYCVKMIRYKFCPDDLKGGDANDLT